jgi:D-serine deaminase-like pyridoxal phosphate-dependent protein
MTTIFELDTPSLLLDLNKLKENIKEVSSFAKKNGVAIRPHIKTHKSINIAKMQLEEGSVGITTAKIAEAEVMAQSGIKDILIAYPISSSLKIARLIKLLQHEVHLKVSVDSKEQIDYLDQGLKHFPHQLEVWIKVNSGLNRCGVDPGSEAVELAKAVMSTTSLKLGGIFTHAGHSYAAKNRKEIEEIGLQEGYAVVESANECEKAGIPILVRSVGSTPTYQIAGKVKGITEVRPGNSAFFDAIQVGLGVTTFNRCALSVLSSVAGVYKNRLVLDSGSKTLCLDKGAHGNQTVTGFGHVVHYSDLTIERLSEEHAVATFTECPSLKLNDKVQIIPNHACTVVNQFDEYVVHEDGKVVGHWKVDARGKSN